MVSSENAGKAGQSLLTKIWSTYSTCATKSSRLITVYNTKIILNKLYFMKSKTLFCLASTFVIQLCNLHWIVFESLKRLIFFFLLTQTNKLHFATEIDLNVSIFFTGYPRDIRWNQSFPLTGIRQVITLKKHKPFILFKPAFKLPAGTGFQPTTDLSVGSPGGGSNTVSACNSQNLISDCICVQNYY